MAVSHRHPGKLLTLSVPRLTGKFLWPSHSSLETLCSKGTRHNMAEERADSCSCCLTSIYVPGHMSSPSFFFKRCSYSRNIALLLSIQQKNQAHTLESYSCLSVIGFTLSPKETSFLLSCTKCSTVYEIVFSLRAPISSSLLRLLRAHSQLVISTRTLPQSFTQTSPWSLISTIFLPLKKV